MIAVLIGIGLGWGMLAVAAALIIGPGIGIADDEAKRSTRCPASPAELDGPTTRVAQRVRRSPAMADLRRLAHGRTADRAGALLGAMVLGGVVAFLIVLEAKYPTGGTR